jgi:CheY-like chemotaxis protein
LDTETVRFRVLLAEDDPVSRVFMREACRACGATITDCADGRQALAMARADAWDLLILDHHLPGLDGHAILAALRAEPDAASHATPAIATSAAAETTTATLRHAGFAEVLPKPMRIGTLRAALRRHGCVVDAELDDEDALRACGSPAAVTRLRRLFAEQELPRIHDEFERLGDDLQSLQPMLHRLRASCGFCGARALAEASATLQRALASGVDAGRLEAARELFRVALADTRAALHAHLDRS